MEDTVAAAKAKEAEEAAKMAEAQKDISANATKGLPICDENNGHCAIPKEFGPNSKGAKQAEAAKKKAEEATRKARARARARVWFRVRVRVRVGVEGRGGDAQGARGR